MPYYQGKYPIKNSDKYVGDLSKPIIYRSSWEFEIMLALDESDKVKHWGSEEIMIPYFNPESEKDVNRYFIDFYVELIDGNKYLIEIKPSKFTNLESYSRERSESAKKEYHKNFLKWMSASEFAKSQNMKFLVLTENEIPVVKELLKSKK